MLGVAARVVDNGHSSYINQSSFIIYRSLERHLESTFFYFNYPDLNGTINFLSRKMKRRLEDNRVDK